MASRAQRIGFGLAFVSLLALSAEASGQRTRQAGAQRTTQTRTAQARTTQPRAQAQTTNRTRAQTTTRQGTARTTNSTNRNVNRNVNSSRNVNVNRNVDVDVHAWGRAPIRAGAYAWPRGYGYVRRPIGYVLPRPFLAASYYYAGWASLGLAAPMAGYQWVRYGPDLFLVEIATGRVTDVRYGVFG